MHSMKALLVVVIWLVGAFSLNPIAHATTIYCAAGQKRVRHYAVPLDAH